MKLLISLLLASSLSVQASQADIDNIEQAAMQLNSTELASLTKQTSGFEQALAFYRLAITQNLTAQAEEALQSLDLAMAELESITKLNQNDDEAWALLAQVYGLKIAYQPMKAAYYGPKSGRALASALAINNENPRAYLVKGISSYNTPAMFGGSKPSALEAFNQSITLYSQDNSTKAWGHAEVHIWRGLANLSLNKKEQALADWHAALAIEPNYDWAKMLISRNK
jgi:hypothetical protein